jgi:hypothetical protein
MIRFTGSIKALSRRASGESVLLFLFFGFVSFSQAEVSSSCRTDFQQHAELVKVRPNCSQLHQWSPLRLNPDCQLYRISDLSDFDRHFLQKLFKTHSIPWDDRDRLSSVLGNLRMLIQKQQASCRVTDADRISKLATGRKSKTEARQELLVSAIRKGSIQGVKDLVALKASPNISIKENGVEVWPLLEAARSGHYEILRYLRDEANAKPLKKISGSQTVIDRIQDEIANCEIPRSGCSEQKKEFLQKSVRILIHFE